MPIPDQEINKDFVLAAADETVGQVLARLPDDRSARLYTYVIVPADGGRFIVVRWIEVERIAAGMGQDMRGLTLAALAGLPAPVAAVERDSLGIQAAREERDAQPGKRLVVLAGGQVVGLLTREVLAADAPGADPFAAVPKRPAVLGIEDDTPVVRRPASLSAAEPPSSPPLAAAAPPDAPTDTRVINGWVEGAGPNQPLQVSTPYELKFNVGSRRADSFVNVGGVGRAIAEAASDQELVTILVVLDPGDFTLYGVDSLEIVVPVAANAPSKNTATFTIEAKKEGANTLNAIFYVNGKLFQKVTMTIQVGGQVAAGEKAVKSASTGITMGTAMNIPAHPRDQSVNVMILAQSAGYQVIAQGGGVARAFLKTSETEVAGWLKYARGALRDIVYLQDAAGNYIYQGENTAIPAEVHQASIKKLAAVGQYLYDELFYGNSGPDARAMGDLLRRLSRRGPLNVQVVAERFFFPWSLLFDGDDADSPDAQDFWGFKHVIEYMPEFTVSTPVNFDPKIEVADTLNMAFVCNNTIDTEIQRPIVQSQREFFNTLERFSVTDYPTVQDLVKLLKGPDGPQLIYFYCHAVSKFPDEGGGVDDSKIKLTDGEIMLRELKTKVRSSLPPLKDCPLVFLNACESAELSPYLYDGLMPFLVARGARGMIGTEVETPALFAAEFAREFIRRFAAGGVTLGDLLRDMRREYLQQKNNIMGLVYALYSSADVRVERAG